MTRRWLSGGLTKDMARLAFRDYLGVGEGTAEVLLALYEAGGTPVLARRLCLTVSTHRPIRIEALYERIRVLRSAMEAEAVDSANGSYWLTEVGLDECRRAMRDMAAAFLSHMNEPRQAQQPKRRRATPHNHTTQAPQLPFSGLLAVA